MIPNRRRYSVASIAATSLSLSLTLSSLGCGGVASNSSPSSSSGKTLTSISVTPPAASASVGATQQFKATATYSDSSTTDVTSTATWTSATTSVATINSSGMATPISAGSATVTAALSGVQGTATLTVTGKAVSSIAVSPATANMAPGGTQQFSAKATYSDGTTADVSSTVTWAAGTPGVATITASGLATGVAQGSTPITATLGGITGTANLNDVPTGATVVIAPTTPVIGSTQTQQFTATLLGFTTFNWFVDNIAGGSTTVGTISSTGLYRPPSKPGSHTITATSSTDSSLTASTSVSIFIFTLSYPSSTVAPSATEQFTATITGAANTVTWSVDGVANGSSTAGTISAAGLYTAPGSLGPHTITATSSADPTATASAAITVNNQTPAAVLTYHNDDARDGAFLEETVLNPANVNSTQFGKLASYPVDGQIYAQPLYVPNVSIPGVGLRNVVFVETQNNTVYAFDADATSPQTLHTFWSKPLGASVHKGDVSGVNPNVGILSTPVIDTTTNIMYLFAEIQNDPFTFHALDIATGNEVLDGPVPVTGSVNGSGLDSENNIINLETDCYQRMGLALSPVTNWVYIPFGSCNHGWVFAYDKKTLLQKAIFNDTPDGGGGGLWASGGAPAIDDTTGDLYLMSGVDPGDPVANGFNDSVLRLDPNSLKVLDFFTPSDNLFLEQNDTDLGSGSNILMPDSPGALYPSVTIGGGKDGNIFVVDRTNMGGYLPNGSNNVIQTLSLGGGINNIFSTPAYWNGTLYYHSNGNVLRSYHWNPNNNPPLTPASVGTVTYNMHGATASVSAQGTTNGIVWDIDNSAYLGNTPSSSGPSVLHAYDATNLNELYNSAQAGSRDTAGTALKFTVPTITGGKVYVPTSTELDIYGPLP